LVWNSVRTENAENQAKGKIEGEVEKPPELPRMANQPPKIKALEPITPSYAPDAPLLEQVREAMRKGIDPDSALAMAKSLPDKPERADAAFILLEYAAEAENGEAALEVGRYFDPTYAGDSGTIVKDPEVAYDWYQLALSQGLLEADIHLSNLRQLVTKQAAEGSYKARELLKTWQ
jgi:TPR repeat protein